MMSMKKSILFIVMLCAGMMLSGCMNIFQEDYLRAAEKYMEKKYGEEFDGLSFYGTHNTDMYVIPRNQPEWKVTVSFDKPRLWNVKFRDNYVAFLLKDELETNVETIAKEVFFDAKALCIPKGTILPDDWDRHTTLEEYSKRNISILYLFVNSEIMNREMDVDLFIQKYGESNLNMTVVNIIYVTGPQLIDLKDTDINSILGARQYISRAFIIYDTEKKVIDEAVDWVDGELDLR